MMDASKASSVTIDFDDYPLNTGTPARGLTKDYDGFIWHNFSVEYSKYGPFQGSGYQYGCTSGDQAGETNGHHPAVVELKGGSFTLQSVELTAGWDKTNTVDVYGYRDGKEVYHVTVDLTDKAPVDAKLDFEDVDKVRFSPGHGKPDDLIGSGDNVIIDDMVFKHVVTSTAAAFHPQVGPHLDPLLHGGHLAIA